MSWKDILVIVSEAEGDEPALALGEALARQCARLPPRGGFPDAAAGRAAGLRADRGRRRLGRTAGPRAAGGGGRAQARRSAAGAIRAQATSCATPRRCRAISGRVAAVHARYADVAVMTRPCDGPGAELREEIIEGVLFHSGPPGADRAAGLERDEHRQARRGGVGRQPRSDAGAFGSGRYSGVRRSGDGADGGRQAENVRPRRSAGRQHRRRTCRAAACRRRCAMSTAWAARLRWRSWKKRRRWAPISS